MIEPVTIDGDKAMAAYFNESFEPVDKDVASLVKLIFEDGRVLFLTMRHEGDTQDAEQPRDDAGRFKAIAGVARKHGFTTPREGGLAHPGRGETVHAKKATGEWTHTHHEGGYGTKVTGSGHEALESHLGQHAKAVAERKKSFSAALKGRGQRRGYSPTGSM